MSYTLSRWLVEGKRKVEYVCSYIAWHPVIGTVQRASHFTGRPVHSNAISTSLSTTLQLLREDYSFTRPPPCVASYSFIQLSELWQRGVNEIAKASKRQQEDSIQGSVD